MALGHLISIREIDYESHTTEGSEDGADDREPERQGLDDPGADYEEYTEDHKVLAFSTR